MRRKQKRQGGERKRRVNRLSFFINILKEKIIFMTNIKSRIKLEPVEGYDWRNYDKKKGIDPTGIDVVSNKVIQQAADLLLGGYSEATARDILYECYGFNSYCAKFILGKAFSKIYNDEKEESENLLKKQNMRLFRLYRSALEREDHKSALMILQEINKLNKLYVNKIEISSDAFTLDLGLDTTNKSDEQGNQ